MKQNPSAKAYLAKWLTVKSRTVFECQKRLKEKGYPEPEIESAIGWGLQNHFLDDIQYVENFIDVTASRRNLSLIQIRKKLSSRGIDFTLIERFLNTRKNMELDAAQKAIKKKYGDQKSDSFDPIKAAQFLQRKGFQFSTIRSLLKNTWESFGF